MSLTQAMTLPTAPLVPFADGEPLSLGKAPLTSSALSVPSPFLAEEELNGELPASEPEVDLVHELLHELHDETFDEVVDELTQHAVERVQMHRRTLPEGEVLGDTRVERLVRDELMPLAAAGEALIAEAQRRVAGTDLAQLGEEELETLFATPSLGVQPAPVFENFLGGLWNKVKSVASSAVSLAKKGVQAAINLGLGPILDKLKSLVRPLLEKVLAFALDKVPATYRPIVEALAKRFLKKPLASVTQAATQFLSPGGGSSNGTATPAEPSASSDAPASGDGVSSDAAIDAAAPDAAELQAELDGSLSELMLTGQNALLPNGAALSPALERLHAARSRFVSELAANEAVEPAVEHFLPALLPVLRLGIKLAGRPRVVNFLGGLLGKLIAPLTGGELAPKLGALLVDVGMRSFLQAEIEHEDPAQLTHEALVHTVEETVRQVSQLPDEVLDHEAMLESFTLDAFDAAARQHLPAAVFKAVQRADAHGGVWVGLPRRGRRYFKKWSRAFDVNLTPQLAGSLPGFGGGHLGSYLRDRLHLPEGMPARARMHVFELMPGGRQAHIVASEQELEGAPVDLHPLTTQAAAALLGKPSLGRDVPGGSLVRAPRVGERFYSLRVERASARRGHVSRVRLRIDPGCGCADVRIILGEPTAQHIATLLRRRARPAVVLKHLRAAIHGHARAHWVHDNNLDPAARRTLKQLALRWTWARIADHLAQNPQEFIQAADQPEQGVVLRLKFAGVPALKGEPASSAQNAQVVPTATIRIVSGARA